MSKPPVYDVLGVGNAIVDILAHAEDGFLRSHGLHKGTMTLIDAATAERLYEAMGPGIECSGGSVANAVASLASLGASTAFVGKVKDDEAGHIFRHDITALGVDFPLPSTDHGPPTARSLIFVTPDAERTMQTYLGACVELGPEDIDPAMIGRAAITYLEGFLWDQEKAKQAFIKAAEAAHAASRRVALSLSDPVCVERHRESFLELVQQHVDILFANEEEIKSLFLVETFEQAVSLAPDHLEIAVLTRGANGSVIIAEGRTYRFDAAPIDAVIDTTGAGDGFAAGFLYGLTQGLGIKRSADIAGLCAAQIISQFGARSTTPLRSILEIAKSGNEPR